MSHLESLSATSFIEYAAAVPAIRRARTDLSASRKSA
jgi:hypothetical protein